VVNSKPKLIHASEEVAQMVGITKEELISNDFLDIFSGKTRKVGILKRRISKK
jgi:hypothetical protein